MRMNGNVYKYQIGEMVKTVDGHEAEVQYRDPVGAIYPKDNAYYLKGLRGSYKERELKSA